jgi:hypothetical protein
MGALRFGAMQGENVEAFGYPLSQVLATSGNFTAGIVTAPAGIGDDSRFYQISFPRRFSREVRHAATPARIRLIARQRGRRLSRPRCFRGACAGRGHPSAATHSRQHPVLNSPRSKQGRRRGAIHGRDHDH